MITKILLILSLVSIFACADNNYSTRVEGTHLKTFSHLAQLSNNVGKNNRHQSKFAKSKKPSEYLKIGVKHKREISNFSKLIEDINQESKNEYVGNNHLDDYQDDYYDVEVHYQDDGSQINKSNYKGYYKIGSEYKILGQTYQPQEYDSFQEVGIASWYGPKFNGQLTANGEIFDMHDLTAAHRTLPLPSVVRVTNLDNNRSAIIRVNDRGPFARDRIIDLSKKSAEILDVIKKGTARVKVEFLKDETQQLLKQLGLK